MAATPPHSELERLRRLLPAVAVRYLDGERHASGGAWSTLLSLARHCHTAGMSGTEFRELIECSEFGESSLFANDRLHAQCDNAWQKIKDDDSDPADADGVRRLVAELVTRIEAHEWTGRTGVTDRAVALAVAQHCHELGTYSPVLSLRYLAERTSIGSPETVSRSLQRLTKLGLLSRVGLTEHRNTQYRLALTWETVPKGQSETSSMVPATCLNLSLHIGHDAFVSRALGPTAERIWLVFDHPVTAAQAAGELGVHEKTARRHLEALTAVGLASKGQDGPSAVYSMLDVSAARLDEIATEYGTLGWHARQRDQHDRQRKARDRAISRDQHHSSSGSAEPPF